MTTKHDAEGPEDSTLASRVTFAAAWMLASRWVDRIIGLLSIAILARLLMPSDFGIIGYAILIIGLLDLFTGLSTDVELIRKEVADRTYYNAAWTMNVLRGVAISVLMLLLMGTAANFFGEPRLAAIMAALAVVPLIQGFENVGVVEFRKQLAFDREFKFLMTSRLLGTLVTLYLAFELRSYWALAWGTIARAALRVALSYGMHPYRPALNCARIPEIFRFSRWMVLQNLASGVHDRLPGFIIGREWNSSALAFFNMGKEIADLAASEIRAPIRRALFPGLARIANRGERVSEVLVESAGMLALLTMPMPLGIALVANDLVPLFLGAQWQPTIAVLQPLCVAASVTALGTNSHLAYMALNRSHLAAIAASIRVLLLLGLLFSFAPSYGAVGVAYAVAGLSCVMVVSDYAVSSYFLGIHTTRFFAAVWRPAAASLAMCVSVLLFRGAFPAATELSGHAWALTWSTLLGSAVYVVSVLGLWAVSGRRDGAERRLITLLATYSARRIRTLG